MGRYQQSKGLTISESLRVVVMIVLHWFARTLAARGLDLDVDHVVMFDFPLNSIDYLHRTGRTARMGAKGKVTSLEAKKDLDLASKIEEALRKNESLDAITKESVRRGIARSQITDQKGKSKKMVEVSKVKGKFSSGSRSGMKSGKGSPVKSMKKGINISKSGKSSTSSSLRKGSSEKRQTSKMVSGTKSTNSKLNVVGFRGKNSFSNNKKSGL